MCVTIHVLYTHTHTKKNAFIKQVASNQCQRSNNVGMATIGFGLAQVYVTLTLDSDVHVVL